MFGSIKAAIASVAASIKSAMPTVVVAATVTTVTGGCIYYYTVKDGMYEKKSDNVRYVLEEYINNITIDNIKKTSDGYAYSKDYEKDVEEIIKKLKKENSVISQYVEKDKQEEFIAKLIKAEIISQYPDLRRETNKEVSDNELQGNIKIERRGTNGSKKTLTYIPYNEFQEKKNNGEADIMNYFSLKESEQILSNNQEENEEEKNEKKLLDLVVAGQTIKTTTTKKTEYTPKIDGSGDEQTLDEETTSSESTYTEISISYQSMLSKYTITTGFLWTMMVMGESTNFVLDLADLAIDNTKIIIEAQDNQTTSLDETVEKYKIKREISTKVGPTDNLESVIAKKEEVDAKQDSEIRNKVVITESNTALNITYAHTWIAEYEKTYENKATGGNINYNWSNEIPDTEWQDVENSKKDRQCNLTLNAKEKEKLKKEELSKYTAKYYKEILKDELNENSELYKFLYSDYQNPLTILSEIIKLEIDGDYSLNKWSELNTKISNYCKPASSANRYINNNTVSKIDAKELRSQINSKIGSIKDNIISKVDAQRTVTEFETQHKIAESFQKVTNAQYMCTETIVTEQKDIDEKENFIAYFQKASRAREYISQSPEWAYEMLESESKTANMLDLFRYLLYQATGNDYGIKEFDFENLLSDDFTSMGSMIVGGSIEDKVWFSLKAQGYSDYAIAGAMGNIYVESQGFNPSIVEIGKDFDTGGIGLCQWTDSTRKNGLINFAKSRNKNWTDVDIQIEYLLGEINQNGGADGYAIFQMGYGNGGYSYKSWLNATNTETAAKAFMELFERPDKSVAQTDERCRLANEYYKKYQGKSLSGGIHDSNGKNGVLGTFTSSITGRCFTIINQGDSAIDLPGMCNRAVAAIIASGYTKNSIQDVVRTVKAGKNYILSDVNATTEFFNKYGLEMSSEYGYSMDNIRTILSQGNTIALQFQGKGVDIRGRSNSLYCYGNSQHWIGIVGYKIENGIECIFIVDPGHGSSGWKQLDEFENCKRRIDYFQVIKMK